MKSGCSLDLFPSRCYLRKRASCVCTFSFSHPPRPLPLSDPSLPFSPLVSPSPFTPLAYILTLVTSQLLVPPGPVSTALPPRPAHKYKSWIIDSKANVGEYCAIGGKPLFTILPRELDPTKERITRPFPPLRIVLRVHLARSYPNLRINFPFPEKMGR